MASRKLILSAVFIALQLLYPCESGLVSEVVNIAEDILHNVANLVLGCDVPEQVCPNSNISYWLYSRDTQDSPHELDPLNSTTISEAGFTQGVPLKVIFHGYTGHRDFSPNMELRPAYFGLGEYNIITVDWKLLAISPCYVQAVENVELVARCAAEFLDILYETRTDVTLANTHIIGLSLGAHVAGLTGANLKTGKAPRVTDDTCDHVRSAEVFAESINSTTGLWGFLCDSFDSYKNGGCNVTSKDELVLLGEAISTLEKGIFLALTNNASLYLLNSSKYIEDEDLVEKSDCICT